MGEIKVINKGHREIYLTRYYNSSGDFVMFKDDVDFNKVPNPFSDYCNEIVCGNSNTDNIKIHSLPDKGFLYYTANPGASSPAYVPVFVGQIFLISDLVNFKVLKFNAEGNSNDQYSGNYLTLFKIERHCDINSTNIITTVKLNMIDIIGTIKNFTVEVPQMCSIIPLGGFLYNKFCVGEKLFQLSEKLNIQFGYVRMTVDPLNGKLYLKKPDDNFLVVNEVLPVTQSLKAFLRTNDIIGVSPPYFPQPIPANPTPVQYTFQYSINGYNNWQTFTIQIKNA